MAGTTHPTKSHFPKGDKSWIPVRMGGYVPNGLTAAVIDTFQLDFDCYVKQVDLSYTGGTADLDGITLKTVDATAKTLATIGDMSADVAGVTQTLHADIIDTLIVRGDKFQLVADSTAASESGHVFVTIWIKPAR